MEKSNYKRKGRVFVGVLYEDSAPSNYEERIRNTHLDGFSIWHDRDLNPDGTLKKKHCHVMLMWDNPTTYRNAKNVLTEIGCIDNIQMVESTIGMARYLTHLDNPEKVQYSKNELTIYGSANYDELTAKSQVENQELKSLTEFIIKNKISSFTDLSLYCMINEPMWFKIIASRNTYYIKTLLSSQYRKLTGQEVSQYIDEETGEQFNNLDEYMDNKKKGENNK